MPEICRFQGIILRMLFRDDEQHHKPHIHAVYGEYKASIALDGTLLSGALPVRQLNMVIGWIALHEEELYDAWNHAVKGESFEKIKPL